MSATISYSSIKQIALGLNPVVNPEFKQELNDAAGIDSPFLRDVALKVIFEQSKYLKTKEAAAELMFDGVAKDEAYRYIIREKMDKWHYVGAYESAMKMGFFSEEGDQIFQKIVENTIDVELAAKAAKQMYVGSSARKASIEIVLAKFLAKIEPLLAGKKYDEIEILVSNPSFKFIKDQLITKIFEKINEKFLDEENLIMIEMLTRDSTGIKDETRKEIYSKLADKYGSLGMEDDVRRVKKRVVYIEEPLKGDDDRNCLLGAATFLATFAAVFFMRYYFGGPSYLDVFEGLKPIK